MAQVQKTDAGTWECRWSGKDPRTGKRRFYKQRFARKEDAKAKQRDVEDRGATGLSVDHRAGKQTLAHWANLWHDDHAATHARTTSQTARVVLDATVIPMLGKMRVRDVTTATVAEFIRDIQAERQGRNKKPLSPATVKRHYQVLSNVLQFAALRHAIPANPAQGVSLPTNKSQGRPEHEYVFLTTEQVQLLAEQFEHPYNLLVRFLAATGLRVGECAGLNIRDVDLTRRVVRVRHTRAKVTGGWEQGTPKSGKSRTVPLTTALVEDLAVYIAEHPHADDDAAPLWPGRRITAHTRHGNVSAVDYDEPWNPAVFYRSVFKPTVRQTQGIPDALRQHDLRHTFASICASNGIPAAQVAVWMGHTNEIVTTTIYTHLFDEDTTRYAAALDHAFSGGGAKVLPFAKEA